MPTIMPQSELVRRAFSYVAEAKVENPGKDVTSLVDDAAMRFNLSPLDAEALQRLFSSDQAADPVEKQ